MLRSGGGGGSGTPGQAATIAPGTATTLAPGASPTVTNSGSSSAAVFNFGIPAGTPGTNGTNGTNGSAATIAPGTVTMLPSTSSPTVTNSGSSSAATFNFGIPYPAVSNLTMLQSAVGWTTTNTVTTAQTATSIVIPANTMTANSQMEITVEYSITGGTTTKTIAIVDNATGFVIATAGGAFASSGFYGQMVRISNRNATNVQFIRSTSIVIPYGTNGANGVTPNLGSLDFTVTRTINFNNTFSATGGTESIKVEAYQVRIWTP